jgi:hypothetical protein
VRCVLSPYLYLLYFVAPRICGQGLELQQIPLSSSGSLYLNRDNVAGVATGYGLDDRGVGFRVRKGEDI